MKKAIAAMFVILIAVAGTAQCAQSAIKVDLQALVNILANNYDSGKFTG